MLKKALVSASMVFLLLTPGVGTAKDPAKPTKVVMSPASSVPTADVVRNFGSRCPNVTVTLDSTKSDFMLDAARWPNGYKFTLFKKGGEAVFSTSTVLLSNAVKDVCNFVNTTK
jgi:hypothetical protein